MARNRPTRHQLACRQSLASVRIHILLGSSFHVSFDVWMASNYHRLIAVGLTTIFYLSYLVSEAPANYLMQKFNMGRFIGICMLFWGKLTALTCCRLC